MKIAVTGHRPGKLGNEWDGIGYYSDSIRDYLQSVIDDVCKVKEEPITLITGMALGVDMIWAELAIDNDIPFIAAIPCVGQEMKWNERQVNRYNKLVNHPLCEMFIVTPTMYNPQVMQIRNEWMEDNCDLLVAVWNGTPGGTANCVEYAKKKNKQIMRLIL